MELQLRQARKFEAIGRMAGGIAHDFNNLLQVLKIQIGLLELMAEHPEKVRKACAFLEKAAVRATEMTSDLLFFARKTEVRLEPTHVTERVNETIELLNVGLPEEVVLSFTCEQKLPEVLLDASKFDRIVTNLVMNSKDAMPSGGKIVISADLVRFEPSMIHLSQGDDVLYLRVKVQDTGTGMDDFTQKRAFEPFFTSKPTGNGTGLGLAVVFGLMQMHNGFVDIQSEAGKGTIVSLFFPVPRVGTYLWSHCLTIPPVGIQLAA